MKFMNTNLTSAIPLRAWTPGTINIYFSHTCTVDKSMLLYDQLYSINTSLFMKHTGMCVLAEKCPSSLYYIFSKY